MSAVIDIATVAGLLRAPARRPGQPLELEMTYGADIDGDCRWWLDRRWTRGDPSTQRILPWIMLNPSTADARMNDPTLWRIIRWSYRWGFDGLLVVNLFPYRSPAPAALREWIKHGGFRATTSNRERVAALLEPYDAAMAAWGAQPGPLGLEVDLAAERVLDEINKRRVGRVLKLFCIGEASGRRPKHPMARGLHRVPDHAEPIPVSNYPGTIVGLKKDAVA